MNQKLKIGALISGGGTNLQAIIDACEAGKIDGEMVFVGSDTPGVKGLKRGEKHGIRTFVVDYSVLIKSFKAAPDAFALPEDFNLDEILSKQNLFSNQALTDKLKSFLSTRAAAEALLLKEMKKTPVDLLVLAGFMRNFTPYFIDRVNRPNETPRIMNIHPAILPAFPGVDGYGDTFRYGCKTGGCTVHFIDYGEDSGPIIGQKTFEIHDFDSLDDIKKRGLEKEWELYPECIQLFAEGRLKTVKLTHTLDNGSLYQRTIVKTAQTG